MEQIKYRGHLTTESELVFIRSLIAAHPHASRRELSKKLSQAWGWVQPNGALRDMVCRGLMLALHRAGQIELPAVRCVMRNPFLERKKPEKVAVDETLIESKLKDLQPLVFRQVRRTPEEKRFNSLLQQYHYLGYTQPVGEHLKYMVYGRDGQLLGCLAWQSAARHLGARDRYIGWSAEARKRNIRYIGYNPRYLILPWVKVPHLASHILGWMARHLPEEWERMYGHPLYFLETFIDVGQYRGTCYRAANWVAMGLTTGRGKNDQTKKQNRSLKEILGLPLTRRFRELMS